MKVDFDKFLEKLEPLGELTASQTQGIGYLLDCIEADININDPRWAAYMLATTWHETAHTMQPIGEYGKGKGRKYGKPDAVTGKVYYGRGYVQITWKGNYETFHRLLHINLVENPELALDPNVAYQIMSIGMRRGLFTGVGLNKYFNVERNDPVNARKIVNGLDCAEKIAGYHGIILEAIHHS